MAARESPGAAGVDAVAQEFGVALERPLGGRSSAKWLVMRREEPLVLRRYSDVLELGPERLHQAIDWQVEVRTRVRRAGWPVAAAIGEPLNSHGAWWTLESWLPGTPAVMTSSQHADLIAQWQRIGDIAEDLGPQPHRLNHLAELNDAEAARYLAQCENAQDRQGLLTRLDQVLAGAQRVTWEASRRTLVHGDLARHNILWAAGDLSGVLDFELATVDRRITEMTHVWRCRHDDVLLAYDQQAPLNDQEWRMLLIDWWALMLSLALFQLRRGRQPGRWELDGLRRTSPLSETLAHNL